MSRSKKQETGGAKLYTLDEYKQKYGENGNGGNVYSYEQYVQRQNRQIANARKMRQNAARAQRIVSMTNADRLLRQKYGTSNPVETMQEMQHPGWTQLQKSMKAGDQKKEEPKQPEQPTNFRDWSRVAQLMDPKSKVNQMIAQRPQDEQDYWQAIRNTIKNNGMEKNGSIEQAKQKYSDDTKALLRIMANGGTADPVKDYQQAVSDWYTWRDSNLYTGNDVHNMSYAQLQQRLAQSEQKISEAEAQEDAFLKQQEEMRAEAEANKAGAADKQRLYYELSERGLPVMNANGENYVPDVSEWGHLDSTNFIRERPEDYFDYEDVRYEYDRMLYDAINGQGAYDAALDEMTDEEIEQLDADMELLWQRLEKGDFKEEANQNINEYLKYSREEQGNFDTDKYRREAEGYRNEIAARDRISDYEAQIQGEHPFNRDNIDYGFTLDKDYMDARNIYAAEDVQDREIGQFGKYIGDHPAQHMTPKQRDTFNGFFENGQYAEAMAYYNELEPYLRQIMKLHKGAMEQDLYSNGWALPMAGYRILTKPVEGVAGTIGTGLALLGDKKWQDPNSEYWDLASTNANIQNTSAEGWGKQFAAWFGGGDEGFAANAGRLLNGVMFSIADNLTAFSMSGGANVLGGDAAAKMSQWIIQGVMSSEATASTMYERLQQGMDPTEAALLAYGSGIIEAITEKYSLEQILDPNVRELLGTKGAFMRYLGKSALAEGSEEIASDLLDTGLDYIMSAIYGNEAELTAKYNQLVADGMDEGEATWSVIWDYVQQLGASGLAGALSGLLMSGSRGVNARIQNSNVNAQVGGKALGNNVDEKADSAAQAGQRATNLFTILETGEGFRAGTESNALAKKIRAEIREGKSINKAEVGSLVRTIANESSDTVSSTMKSILGDAFMEELNSKGIVGDYAENARDALLNIIVNGEYDAKTLQVIAGSKAAQQILAEYKMGGYAEETKKAMDLTQQEREAQKSVMQMITEPKAETLTKDEIRDRLQGAEWLDKTEQEKIKGLTGKSTEIAIDGEAAEIVGFGAKNVEEEIDGEKKKYSVATVKLADGREVEISAVDAMNKGAAQVLKFMQAEAGKSVGSNLGVTLLDVAAKAKDTAQAVTDAVNVMWSEALGIGTGKTNLDTKTEQRIREAVKKDIDAGAAARAKMMKEIRPGQGKVTMEGAVAGTKEYNAALAKLGKNIRVEAEFIAGMMKSLGMDVKMYWNPEESAKQGVYYGGEDGGIRVNLAGTYDTKGTHRSAVATVAHEGTHWLAANAPKAYQQMRSFTITNLAKNGVNVKAELRRIMDNYERHGESLDLNGAIDEMVAMGFEQVLTNEKLAAKLKTQDPETHGKLRQAVKWVVDKIREVIGSVRTTSSKYARSLMNVADEAARIWGIAYEEAKGATETGIGTEAKASVMDVDQNVVTKGMSDAERFNVLSGTMVEVKNATGKLSNNYLTYFDNLNLSNAEIPFANLARRYGLIKNGDREAVQLKNKYIQDMKAVFSNKSLQESIHHQEKGFANLAALFPVLKETYENAVPVLVQDDRYKLTVKDDTRINTYMYLLGAYRYGNSIIPVLFEVKRIDDLGNDSLYVVATIKRDAIMSNGPEMTGSLNTASSIVSIEQIIQNIKRDQTNFLQVIPSQLLSTEQKKGKREGLRKQGEYIQSKALKEGKKNTDTVHMTTERIDGIIEKYSNRAYIARINPNDFIDLTVSNADRLLNKGRVLVASEMQKEDSTPFLRYDPITGRITGFEGRNRMAALAVARVKNAAVLMIPSRSGNNFVNETNDTLTVNGKGRTAEVSTMIPVNEENRDNIINEYGNENESWFRYSMRDEMDQQYAEAVEKGDWTTAEKMLLDKMQQTEGITGYRAPHFYAGEHKDIARLIKSGDQDVINSIVEDMAQHVPENAVLVPMPPHEGKVTDSTDTMILAKALSKATGAPVVVALESDYHESRYKAKAAGDRSVNAQTMGFRQVAEIPEGKMPVFIDNMVGGGQTAMAAKNAVGRGITLAYAQSSRSKSLGVKAVSVTYDQNGKLIPLSQRMDPNNKSWKYSFQDDRYMDIVNSGDMETAQWMVDQMAEAMMENSLVRGEDGKLLKMYHGTKADFNEFKREYIGSTGRFEGSGFNFTPYEGRAKSYGGNVLAGYLDIQKPLSAEKKTISIVKLAQIIREADPTGDNIISDYARETRDYGTEAFIRRESMTAARNIWESSDNDVDIYSYISSADSDAEGLIAKFEELGYDGLIHYDDNGKIKTAIAFSSNQFKRADPVIYNENNEPIKLSERFNMEKPDIRYSMRYLEEEYNKSIEAGDKYVMYFVKEAARMNGFNPDIVGYHGSDRFGFTEFDMGASQGEIFVALNPRIAMTYTNTGEQRQIWKNYNKMNLENMSMERLAKEIREYFTLFNDESRIKSVEGLTAGEFRDLVEKEIEEIKKLAAGTSVEQELADVLDSMMRVNENTSREEKKRIEEELLKVRAAKDISEELYNRITFFTSYKRDALYSGEDVFHLDTAEKRGMFKGYYLSRSAVIRQLKGSMDNSGIYSFFMRNGKQLVIDAKRANWNKIAVPWDDTKYYTTREITDYAKKNGYDSVRINNVYDHGGRQLHERDYGFGDIAAYFNPEDVKSADPVTYDNNGDMIQLSERFSRSKDIRWSMRDDTDYDVRAWMETVPEWSLGTEAEKKLLGDYKSLRTKQQLDRMRMQKIDRELLNLEASLVDERRERIEAQESMENALESAGVSVRDGKWLQKDGKIIAKIETDGSFTMNKGADESAYAAMKKAGFMFNGRKVTYRTGALEAPTRADGKAPVNVLLGKSEALRQRDALEIKKKNLQTVMDQTEEKLNQILGNEGFGRMMYQQAKVLEDFAYNKTQAEVTDAVNRMDQAAKDIQARIEENRKATEALEKSDVVKRFRELLGTTTAEQTAAELKKEYSSTWTAKQIRAYLDPIILKMKTGEDFKADVETLAGILVGSDSRNTYETLSDLRGLVITLGKGAQKELKAQNSSLKEVRARLAGTGIQVKYGDRSTLEADIEDLRAEYPMIPELGDEKDALGNFLNWIDSMKSASAGMEFYDQRIAEAMAFITGKAAGAAKGIYMPNDPKAQKQVLAMMDFVKGLNAETQQAQKALADVARQMEEMQKAGQAANTKATVLMRDVNVALDYYNKISRMAVDETKLKKTSAIVEQLKSDQAKKILENNEEWRQLIQRDAEARKELENNRKYARQVNTNLKRMWNLLKSPKGLNNIPEHMQGLAREVISMFVNNDMGRGWRFMQATQDELKERRRVLDAWEKQSGKFDRGALAAMDPENVKIDTILADLDAITEGLRTLNAQRINGKNKLDSLQQRGAILEGIRDAVGEIYTAIKAEQEVFSNGKKMSVEDAAYAVAQGTKGKKYREWTGAAGQKMAMLHKFLVTGTITPEYFFRTLGNAGLSDLWENYHNAENRNGLELQRAKEKLAQIAEEYGYKNWDMKQKITLNLESGDVEVTLGQLMSLWATWQREQTLGPEMSQHLTKGGFYAEQDLREGILGRQAVEKRAHVVTEEDMNYVLTKLTVDQVNFIDAVVKYMSNDMSALGNAASMAAYGIKLYKESYYFPFQIWNGVKSRKSNDAGSAAAAGQDRAFHPSFSKSRMHGAANALVIGDFMQTATDHIAGMINYATMGLANESLMKVLNQQTNADLYGTKRNTEALLEEAYGREAMQYLRELQVQLNGGAVKIEKTFYDKLISAFRKNAVAGSLSVALQQPLSYMRAAMMIDGKYLARAISPDVWKGSYKEMMAHSGVAVIKEMGRFDMNFGSSAREYLTPDGKEGKARAAWNWVADKSTMLPELMDRMTWTRMWSAVKAEQKALHPEMDVKSDEFLDMCGVRFNDVMRRTQVYDSTLVKSANMRSQNPAMKMLTSFMAEPTLTLNVMADSFRMAIQGEKGGKTLAVKSSVIFLIGAVFQAAVKGAMGARRNPDDKKTWGENFWYRFWYNFIGEANPMQLVPGYDELITALKGGDISDDAMGTLSKLFKSVDKVGDLIGGKTDAWRGIEDSAGQIVQLFTRVPVKNLMRDMRATWNWIGTDPYAKREDSDAVLKYQFKDLFMNADNLLGVVNKKLGEAGWETSNSAYYKRIYQAKKEGREQDAADMIEYLLKGKGVKKEDSITSGVNSVAKNDKTQTPEERLDFLMNNGGGQLGAYVAEMYEKGEIDREEAERLYKKQNPKATDKDVLEALDRVDYKKEGGEDESFSNYTRLEEAMDAGDAEQVQKEKEYLLSNGFKAEDINSKMKSIYTDRYKKGEIDRSEAEAMLKKWRPDLSADDIFWTLDRIDYKKETGNDAGSETYYRLKDAINANNSTDIRAEVKKLLDHGYDKDKIKGWIGKKSTGFKEAYLNATGNEKVKIKNALIQAYKAIGLTDSEANEIINKWTKDSKKKN